MITEINITDTEGTLWILLSSSKERKYFRRKKGTTTPEATKESEVPDGVSSLAETLFSQEEFSYINVKRYV